MAVITFYGDDSADMKERLFAVAGYVSTADEWDEFSREWLSVIHDSCWPTEITEFHATDCENQRGEFETWCKRDCTALVTRLVDVIVNPKYASLQGVGCAVMVEDLSSDPDSAKSSERVRVGYLMCAQMMFLLVGGSALSRAHEELIEFTFDDRPGVRGRATKLFELLQNPPDRRLVPALMGRLENPIFRSSKTSPPLQAADLLAYETQKHAFNRRYDPRPTRRSLERMIEGRKHRGAHITRDFIDEIQRRDKAREDLSTLRHPDIYRLKGHA